MLVLHYYYGAIVCNKYSEMSSTVILTKQMKTTQSVAELMAHCREYEDVMETEGR